MAESSVKLLILLRGCKCCVSFFAPPDSIITALLSESIVEKAEPLASCLVNSRSSPHWSIPPVVNIITHHANAVGEGYLRLPSQIFADLRNIGPGAVRFARTLR